MSGSTDTREKAKLPPMLVQYLDYKSQYPDCFLFFQVGDFYELFFEDAVSVSKILNLTLTSRDKSNPDPVPMAGVPMGVIDGYIERLVANGHSVALVSQVGEVPEAGSGKSVQRKLDRIITPGVRLLGTLENSSEEQVVASVALASEQEVAIAYSSVQSGMVWVRDTLDLRSLVGELQRITPCEIVLPQQCLGQRLDRRTSWVRELEVKISKAAIKFRAENVAARSATQRRELSAITGYAGLSSVAQRAFRMLLSFVDEITVDRQVPVSEIKTKSYDQVVGIDATSRANLELTKNLRDGSRTGTLLALLDRTRSLAGARLLQQWIINPLASIQPIMARQDVVSLFKSTSHLRTQIQDILKHAPDVERIAARIELSVSSPRELGALRDLMSKIPQIESLLSELRAERTLPLLEELVQGLQVPKKAQSELQRVLVDSPPMSVNEGGIVREGVDAELDRLKGIRTHGRSWIAELEQSERQRSGIGSLKIKFNGVLGFFIEITQANVEKVPSDYIRRQSTANTERYTTIALKERESEVLGAESRQIQIEKALFEKLRESIKAEVLAFKGIARALAHVDVLASLGEVAEHEDYVAPQLSESTDLKLVDARHPVLSQILGLQFVPNSLGLDQSSRFCIITGPNMGGKSTYLRQAALLVIMAQMGSFVPARSAAVGLVDQVFARLGASDNLIEGESTFMLEMREVSNILARATSRSLLLVDEVGRGTATLDGLAVARSILEFIVTSVSARTLFATHYHELTALAESLPGVANLSVGSYQKGEDLIFTHEIKAGSANRSYGLEVAKLAGLPSEVIVRARELLNEALATNPPSVSELASKNGQTAKRSPQLTLFNNVHPNQNTAGTSISREQRLKELADLKKLSTLSEKLATLDINATTPIKALQVLDELKHVLSNSEQNSKEDCASNQ